MTDAGDLKVSATKAGSAWVGVGAVSTWDWGAIAAVLAAVYTALLIVEWLWKKAIRPLAESRGWVKRRRNRRHSDDDTDRGDL